jgi:tRNA G37 N-methylase TrmD
MIWKIFSLYPQIFQSFLETSLVARAIDKKILKFEIINWRNFGTGNYKQVDDRPFGGGSGMVLQVEPIVKALIAHNSLSDFGKIQLFKLEKIGQKITTNQQISNIQDQKKSEIEIDYQMLPNNSKFYSWFENEKKTQEKLQHNLQKDKNIEQTNLTTLENSYFEQSCENLNSENKLENKQENSNNQFKNKDVKMKKATILLTPRGFPLDQKICHWLSEFDQISLICGRFEGFDYRVNQIIDLEISIGNFVCNGGEIPAMCLIEAVSRLIPGFITKSSSHLHDSFSDQNNEYLEQKEFVVGKNKLQEFQTDYNNLQEIKTKLENLHKD